MEPITIKDRDDVKAFINAQDDARQRACATFIASRAALRVAPYAIQFFEFNPRTENPNATSLIIWPCLLASAVANIMFTDEIKRAAGDFTIAFDIHAAFNPDASTHAAVNAAYVVALDFSTELLTETIDQTINAPGTDMWSEVNRDAQLWVEHIENNADQNPGIVSPLWSNKNPSEHDWHTLRKKLLAADTLDDRGADWSFWVKWYDDILAGNPQNWNMLHEIATTDAIDWDAPAREVNDRINQIVENYALKNSYYFERIEFSEAKQKLIVVPEGSFDGASVQTAYQLLRDAIEDVRDAPKEGNLDPEYALRDEIWILEKTLDRPTTQPIFVVEKCFDCAKRIQARLDDATIYGHDVEDFQKALTRSALDIFGADEDARRIVERRTNENLLSLAKEDRDRLSHFFEKAAPIIGEDLKADLETDLSGDADPQTEGEGSTQRGVSRLLRIGIWVRENKDNIAFNLTLISAAIAVIQLIFGFFSDY